MEYHIICGECHCSSSRASCTMWEPSKAGCSQLNTYSAQITSWRSPYWSKRPFRKSNSLWHLCTWQCVLSAALQLAKFIQMILMCWRRIMG
jgi:hypothetical protein